MTNPQSPMKCSLAALALLAAGAAAANPYECLIQPNQTVEVRSSVEGVIEKVLVQRGDRVRAGQVLVQLESAADSSCTSTWPASTRSPRCTSTFSITPSTELRTSTVWFGWIRHS